MRSSLITDKVKASYQILAGPTADARGIESLCMANLKRMYRNEAMRHHPDRAASRGTDVEMNRIQEVNAAYATLKRYLLVRNGLLPPSLKTRAPRRRRVHLWQQAMPGWEVRLGEYLYYTRRISWEMLMAAIAWQRRQQPRFGVVAQRSGVLSNQQVRAAIGNRLPKERLGEAAVRLGSMSMVQREMVLKQQVQAKPPIGEYFIKAGAFNAIQLDALQVECKRHNARLAHSRRPASPAWAVG